MKLLLMVLATMTLSGCSFLPVNNIPPGQGLRCDVGSYPNAFSTETLYARRNCETVPLRGARS